MQERLAIVGIGCRFPGGADSPQLFWEMLCAGTDAIREIRTDRWNIAAHYHPIAGRAGKSISKWGGFIEDIGKFDSSFFGISSREADAMDPQQRLLLEASWEALEDAGQKLEELRGSSMGVFVGISTTDYSNLQTNADGSNIADVYSATGSAISIAANRISYSFDLRGPSLAVDTACSSALTACHVACQSLWRGDCNMAIVAGVNALLSHNTFVAFSRMSMLSPDGRCKAFDASANGFVRGEGVGAVILRPLSDALASGDRIYAVIRATAANQDGHTNGITVPSRQAQASLIREACRSAGVLPSEITYLEAHGTGTSIGDPIEAAALGSVLSEGRKAPCLIGSVKTNIGHLEAASGIASLIKVALVLNHKKIPPSLHFKTPNPNIDFDGLKLRVVERLEDFPECAGPLLAGVNSFGFGGANAHVILEAAPSCLTVDGAPAERCTLQRLVLPLSAHSTDALRSAASNYHSLLSQSGVDTRSLCGAAATRRSGFAHRLCVTADSREEMLGRLQDFASGATHQDIVIGEVVSNTGPVLVFSGHGPQWWGMGRELMREESAFRSKIEECDAILHSFANWSLIDELSRDERTSRLQETAIAQPAIFALQVALASVWLSWGVQPEAVVGHSLGEVAAAHVAGVLTLREAVRVIFHRGRCMNRAPNTGRMLAANLTADQAEEVVAGYAGEACIAAFNSPTSVTFSGDEGPLQTVSSLLDARGIFNRFLKVNYAFHSHQMDVVREDLLAALGTVETSPTRLKLVSTVTGMPASGSDFDADYWWRNVRQPVRFSDAITELCSHGHNLFLELSAHPALTVSISDTLAQRSVPGKSFFSLRRNQPELATMITNLCGLFVVGSPICWKSIYPGDVRNVPLPRYPWQRQDHWRESRMMRATRLAAPLHPFLTRRLDTARPIWNATLDLSAFPWLKDHRIEGHILFPGAGYVEAALGIGRVLFNALPLEIADVDFQRALYLPEGKDSVELQSEFSPIHSSLIFSSRRSGDNAEWIVNATAAVRAQTGIAPQAVDVTGLKTKLPMRLERSAVYSACEKRGLTYGPMFRAVGTVWRSDKEALGRIELPPVAEDDAGQFQIHPALLDACFQVMLFAAPESSDRRTLLPVRVDRIVLSAHPEKVIYCHAELVQSSSHFMIWNLQICSESGRPIAEAEGCRVQALHGTNVPCANDPEDWLYKIKWIEKPPVDPSTDAERAIAGTWLILADRSGVAERFAAHLKEWGGVPSLLYADDWTRSCEDGSFELATSFHTEIHSYLDANAGRGDRKLAGVVHLWSLDAREPNELDSRSLSQAEVCTCHSTLQILQAIERHRAAAPIWIVTRGGQSVHAADVVSVAQSPAIGIARTAGTELQRLSLRLVDLEPGSAGQAADHLWREIVSRDVETEVAWRGNARFANRVAHTTLQSFVSRQSKSHKRGYVLRLPPSGIMDELVFNEIERRKPRAHEVEIEVVAAGLNFRDVLKSLGAYPLESDRDMFLGDECSGRIVWVGRKVTEFKAGDHVLACGAGCFASHLTVPAAYVVPKPARLSFEEAAIIPVAFMTAWFALQNLGKIRRGDRILIHAATGGVGLAAIQVAQLAGARIFATAGSEEKRNYLRELGVRHILDSRSTAFAAEIRKLTHGEGVDLVLNSLAGDAIAKGLSVLAPGGRFLEIGKRDVYANTAIGLRSLRHNISMHVIDMGQVIADQPETVHILLQTIMKLFRAGEFRPLPHRMLPISGAAGAFRFMAQAKHIGKIVLSTKSTDFAAIAVPQRAPVKLSPRASYLITGGLGGFGLEVAKWLVERGARSLVLVGRRGANTPDIRQAVANLEQLGAKVLVVKCDVSDEHQVERMFQTIGKQMDPLRGIFHAAMVLEDGAVLQPTPERFSRVMAPKAAGAWNLHCASAKLKLDYFVLFSSIAAVLGTPGQANYAAANCFLDALAQYRRGIGLPALAVNWGALSDAGVLQRNIMLAEYLAGYGVFGMPLAQATEMLGMMMQTEAAQVGFMHVDWKMIFADSSNASPSPRFSEVAVSKRLEEPGESKDIRALIRSSLPPERQAVVEAFVAKTAAEVMRIGVDKLNANRPLSEMGLDSLMAFELINRLEDGSSVSLSTTSISTNSTIGTLAAVILEALGCASSAETRQPATNRIDQADLPSADEPMFGLEQVAILRGEGTEPPVFFIHQAGGETDIYADLVSQLPEGFPVYGIQSRALWGAEDEWSSLDEMAVSYAQIAASLQPDGALRLAGFSAGGFIALATVRELERRGRKVSFVGMIETPLAVLDPGCARVLILRNLIAEMLDSRVGEKTMERLNRSDEFDTSILELAGHIVTETDDAARFDRVKAWFAHHGVALDIDQNRNGGFGGQASLKLTIRHSNLIDTREIESLDAPVWIWQADRSWLTNEPISAETRRRVTRGLLTEGRIGGRHFESMHPPCVDVLAGLFAKALTESQAMAEAGLATQVAGL